MSMELIKQEFRAACLPIVQRVAEFIADPEAVPTKEEAAEDPKLLLYCELIRVVRDNPGICTRAYVDKKTGEEHNGLDAEFKPTETPGLWDVVPNISTYGRPAARRWWNMLTILEAAGIEVQKAWWRNPLTGRSELVNKRFSIPGATVPVAAKLDAEATDFI